MFILPCDLNITELDLSNKGLTECPDLSRYTKLIKLDISRNKLSHLDNLHPGLLELDCSDNKLTHLNNLPYGLQELYCIYNPLKYEFKPTLENIRKHNQNR